MLLVFACSRLMTVAVFVLNSRIINKIPLPFQSEKSLSQCFVSKLFKYFSTIFFTSRNNG